MKNIPVLTVVPAKIASHLSSDRILKDFNTLPRVNKVLLETVREYMRDNVGYGNLPMACLSIPRAQHNGSIADLVQRYLPVNSKDSLLFQLEIPEDMIVRLNYSRMLELSSELDRTSDPEMVDFIQEDIRDELDVGMPSNPADCIFFIPFLAVDKCKFYAKFDSNFATEELNLPGIEKMTLTELSAFYN